LFLRIFSQLLFHFVIFWSIFPKFSYKIFCSLEKIFI
jgi:hypothetical protein